MNGIGFSELIVIAGVLLVFMGPKQMVALVRLAVKTWFKAKRFAENLRDELFDTPEIRKMIAEIKHEVYGEEPQSNSPQKESESHDH